jgi:uncharacterized membrane protein
MSKKAGLIRATLVGGLLYLLPIVVLLVILGKAIELMRGITAPLVRAIEDVGLGHIFTPQVVAIVVLLGLCMAAGLFAQTRIAKQFGELLEGKILSNLPGYSFYKSLGNSLAGVAPEGVRAVVMASIEDAWQIAMVMDELEDGLLAVYVPDVPSGGSGALYFMTPDRVRPLNVPIPAAMSALRRMGIGSRQILTTTAPPA